MKEFSWKREWDAKGIPVEKAVKVFEEVTEKYGRLTPTALVEYSKNPKSPLYAIFEWDNEKAADKWREQQARLLINNIEVKIISDGEPRSVGAYEIIRTKEGAREYKSIDILSVDEVEQVREETLNTLIQAQNKLKLYRRFDNINFDLGILIEKLRTVEA